MADRLGLQLRLVWSDIPHVSERIKERAEAVVLKAAHDIEAGAKQRVPVDTGALRNSIQVWREGRWRAYIAPHMEYAAYVEFGTRRQRARPYMRPAAEAVRPGFVQAMERLLRR